MNKPWSFILLVALMIIFIPLTAQAGSKIRGRVTDNSTGAPLPGANVFLEGTSLGSATDMDGTYTINNVPPGNYTLQVKYLGYTPTKFEITIGNNVVLEQNAKLEYMVIEGEELVVTAQAEGQMQAINQQITSTSIKNIVSSAKIQELPESNAAEAVGRLPGVSLQREGGEGNKVVIRGLSPQYNKIQINGVSMTATGENDRSVDLSMISPNVLEGIEVSKTAMADQEADQLGGTVNFVLRGAPKKPTLNATVQGGYNGLHDEVNNYYYVLGGGKRFFDNRLGVFVQGNLEKTDRSDNSASAGYEMLHDTLTLANSLTLQDVTRTNKRTGGVLVLDYETPTTQIKFSNTLNNIDINTFQRQEVFAPKGRSQSYRGVHTEKSLLVMMNALDIEQTLGEIKITGGISYSKSKTETPERIILNAVADNAFNQNWTWDDYQINPFEFVNKALNDTSNTTLDSLKRSTYDILEEETSGKLNFEYAFRTNFADFNIKVGGQYKHKYKSYDYEQSEIPINWNDQTIAREYLKNKFGLTNYNSAEDFPYAPFLDRDYDAGDFKAGIDYTISRVPDENTMVDAYHEIQDLQAAKQTVYYDYVSSASNDYYGFEDYYAAYILPTITFWHKKVTFIPGVRYEHNKTEYTANRSYMPGRDTDPYIYEEYTSTRKNDYFLPMIHVKYQANDWFDVRASYTQTLSRPSYNRVVPKWTTAGNSITWNNTDLEPAKSQNYDLAFSFYTEKIGLFSIGGFHKQIKDFIFSTTTWIADSSYLNSEWPASVKPGGQINGYINSPNEAKLWGLETEWQSNFWFLPGALKGLVLNINYTYTHSSLEYPRAVPVYDTVQVGPIKIPQVVGTADEGYEARLLDQPSHILNVTVGFDYAGFSIRSSVQFKSDVFTATNWYEQLRGTTDPLTLWDMKVKQKLPLQGLQVYLNLNNITKAVDQSTNEGTGWFTNRSYYGMSANLGITYILN